MQIVAVQFNAAWEDKAGNHQRLESLLRSAEIAPNALVVLPEMFDTGFSMNLSTVAQSESRESEAFLRAMAMEHQCVLLGGVAGPIVENTSCNEAVAFGPDGQELVRYRKMQPFSLSREGDFYARGQQQQSFVWQGATIAPFICYDLRFPELFRPAVQDGAEMIVVIACWPAVRSEHWYRLLQARAIENLACVLGVNRCGSEPKLEFDGRSSLFDHMGICVFQADAAEQILKAEVDIEAARAWRRKFPALRDMQLTEGKV